MLGASTSKAERLPVRLFNGAQRTLEALGRRPRTFVESKEALHEAARKAAAFSDFGDASYHAGLDVLLDSYDRESRLTPFGRMLVQTQLQTVLRNRLMVEKALAERPEIATHEIRAPIFVLGLPRTGTTALHHLLGQDPGIQALEYWLAAAPMPRPPRAAWEKNPHFKQAARDLKMTYWLDPSLKAIHLMTADGPEECRHLLQQNFTDDTFDCNSTLPSYSDWYATCDMRPTYRRHRLLLQVIGANTPERRWVLKYPVHMRNLRVVLETYPDARFVQCHRDPSKVLPSICSLVAGWRAIYEGEVDKRAIADWQLELWARSMEHGMEVRDEQDSSRFFDLDFREVLSDPLAAVRRIYQHFGMEMTEDAERRIATHHAHNPRDKFGRHRYTAEEFGLTDARIADRYAAYIDHFGIEREGLG